MEPVDRISADVIPLGDDLEISLQQLSHAGEVQNLLSALRSEERMTAGDEQMAYLASLVTAEGSTAAPSALPGRRKAAFVALVVGATLVAGSSAAAAGALPDTLQSSAARVAAVVGVDIDDGRHDRTTSGKPSPEASSKTESTPKPGDAGAPSGGTPAGAVSGAPGSSPSDVNGERGSGAPGSTTGGSGAAPAGGSVDVPPVTTEPVTAPPKQTGGHDDGEDDDDDHDHDGDGEDVDHDGEDDGEDEEEGGDDD